MKVYITTFAMHYEGSDVIAVAFMRDVAKRLGEAHALANLPTYGLSFNWRSNHDGTAEFCTLLDNYTLSVEGHEVVP